MKKMMIVAIMAFVVAFAQGAEIVTVRGRGAGVDKTEALKDAYRDAVEQAVGLYVDAEQMVNNEELVKDHILTQSNAYIESYKIAKESTTANGLVFVTILADVRSRALTKKIRDVMPSNVIQLGDVSKNLHAQIVTDFKANDDALSIVRNELKDLQPLKHLMKVTLKTVKPIVESVEEDSSLVRLWYPVRVEVDTKKYYNEFAPRWSRILDQIKIAPSKRLELKNNLSYVKKYNNLIAKRFGTGRRGRAGIMTRCEEASAPYCCNNWACDDVLCRYGVALNEEYMGMMFLDTRILGKDYILHGCGGLDPAAELDIHDDVLRKNSRTIRREYISRIWHSQPSLVSRFDGDSCFCIGLLTSEKGLMLTGTLYKIPRDCVNEIVGWQHDTVCNSREGDTFRETAPSIDYKLCFMTRGGVEIVDRAFSLRNLEMMNIVCVMLENMEEKRGRNGCEYTGGTQLWMITPLVGGFAKSFVKWISVDLPKDYVAKIASATISVKE